MNRSPRSEKHSKPMLGGSYSHKNKSLFSLWIGFVIVLSTVVTRASTAVETGAACQNAPPYATVSMGASFVGEQKQIKGLKHAKTLYLTEAQKNQFALQVKDGSIYIKRDLSKPLTTKRALYVMDPNGTIYAANRELVASAGILLGRQPSVKGQMDQFALLHHSSFLAGQPVAAAGHITIRNGKVISIDNKSGHYLPSACHLQQALVQLKSHGADTTDVKIATAD